ncbi:MAG TPA: hypothetical protein VNE17_02625 [Nitrolancea sp.]|nr:hypothetical protein [Nitrolancea sp.]
METRQQATGDLTSTHPGAYRWLRITAPFVLLLVLIQAVLAGRGLSFGGDAIDIHGMVANLTGLMVLIQVVLAFAAGIRGRFRSLLLGTNVLLLILVIAQFGLGYGGRDNRTAAALHVPNGVLIFGVATVVACLVWLASPRREVLPSR